MKQFIKSYWKRALLFLFLSAGLIYITHSLLMSIGIVLILFVIDALIVNWEYRRKTREVFDELRRAQKEKEEKEKS